MTKPTMQTPAGLLDLETAQLRDSLEPGHVLHTMICEHEKILDYLGKIETASRAMQLWSRIPENREPLEALRAAASHLIAAEPHHQREEEVLFPEMEKRGLFGPPAVMRQEHVELRTMKHRLVEISSAIGEKNFLELQKLLPGAAHGLASFLRLHIEKENRVLYPMALHTIAAKEDWARMKLECDRIGYCCFTPGGRGK